MEHKCKKCGKIVNEVDYPVILMPYPHIECPNCGEWIICF